MSFYSKYSNEDSKIFSLVLDFNENLTVLSASDDFYSFIGYTKEEFQKTLNNSFLYILHPSDIANINDIILDNTSAFQGKEINFMCGLITKNNNSKFIRLAIKYHYTQYKYITLQTTLFDISSSVDSFTMPSLLDEYYVFLDGITDDYFFDYDLSQDVFQSGNSFSKLLNIPKRIFDFKNFIAESDILNKDDFIDIFSTDFVADELYYSEFSIKTKDTTFTFLMRYKAIFNNKNKPIHILGRIIDITNKTLDLDSIPAIRKYDRLTKLLNKNIAYDLIRKAVERDDDFENAALFLIDLKNFTSINDNFGHIYGDAILSEYANFLKQTFRNIDVIARVGGDDFLVFIKNYHNQSLLIQKANQIHKLFKKPIHSNDKKLEIHADIGIATAKKGSDFKTLLKKAGLALNKAKADSNNFFSLYSEDIVDYNYKTNFSQINTYNSPQDNFGDNIGSYIFNLLYKAADFNSAITSILHLITDHFNFTSSFITEFSDDSRFLISEYSWFNNDNNIALTLHNAPVTEYLFLTVPIINSKSLVIDSFNETDERINKLLNRNLVRSLVSIALIDDGKTIGFISFTSDEAIDSITQKQFSKLLGIAKIVSVFLAKHNFKAKLNL